MKPPSTKTISQIAALWGVSIKTVRRHIDDGTLPVIRHNSRVIRISDIDAGVAYASIRGIVHKSEIISKTPSAFTEPWVISDCATPGKAQPNRT